MVGSALRLDRARFSYFPTKTRKSHPNSDRVAFSFPAILCLWSPPLTWLLTSCRLCPRPFTGWRRIVILEIHRHCSASAMFEFPMHGLAVHPRITLRIIRNNIEHFPCPCTFLHMRRMYVQVITRDFPIIIIVHVSHLPIIPPSSTYRRTSPTWRLGPSTDSTFWSIIPPFRVSNTAVEPTNIAVSTVTANIIFLFHHHSISCPPTQPYHMANAIFGPLRISHLPYATPEGTQKLHCPIQYYLFRPRQ